MVSLLFFFKFQEPIAKTRKLIGDAGIKFTNMVCRLKVTVYFTNTEIMLISGIYAFP